MTYQEATDSSKNIITTTSAISLLYTPNELLDFEILIYISGGINIISLNKKTTIIELSQYLNSDIYLLLPNIQDIGFHKYILLGPSVNKYSNNWHDFQIKYLQKIFFANDFRRFSRKSF